MNFAETLIYREAIAKDQASLIHLHNLNVRRGKEAQELGFLLAEISAEDWQKQGDRGVRYLVAENQQGEILGLTSASEIALTPQQIESLEWRDPSFPATLYGKLHCLIHTLSIKPQYQGKGIAQALYRELFTRFPQHYFSAFVVAEPILNRRSLQFHQQQGFAIMAQVNHAQFLDFSNYVAYLMLKLPQS